MAPRGRKRASGSKSKPRRRGRKVVRQDIATLWPMKWINDRIVNFVGKVMIQPWRGCGAAKVHVFSLHLMGALLGGANPTDPYDFAAVGRWYDRVPGDISSLGEILIPGNPNGNHWNFIRVRVQAKKIELWDSLGLQTSNATYLAAAERFVKDTLTREESAGRTAAGQGWYVG